MENNFTMNRDNNRFEMQIDGHTAFIDYIARDKSMSLIHTEVPKELEGKGHGRRLVENTLQYMKENDYSLVPMCSFVVTYLKRHPEWNSLLEEK